MRKKFVVFQKSLTSLKTIHNEILGKTMPQAERQNKDLVQSFKEENTLLNLANVSAEELSREVDSIQGNLE